MISIRQTAIEPQAHPHACRGQVRPSSIRRSEAETTRPENPEAGDSSKKFLQLEQEPANILATFCALLKSIMKNNTGLEPAVTVFNLNGKVSIDIEAFI